MASKRPGTDSVVEEDQKKRKHRAITVHQKVDLLKELDEGVSVRNLCQQYNLGSSTVYDIKKQKYEILEFYSGSVSKKNMEIRKTLRRGKCSDLDSALFKWIKLRRSGNVPVSGEMIMDQAKILHAKLNLQHECEYSQGWLQKFKMRHGISLNRKKSSADKDTGAKCIDEFAQLIAREKLSPEQVYSVDETTLYWRCLPGKTVAQEEKKSFGSKDGMSVLGCSNAAGTHKTKLLVIGKSVNPKCFSGVEVFPVIYRGNKKGCMTAEIFREWFEQYFVQEARAHCTSVGLDPNCKIVLLLDNCSSHPDATLLVKDNVMGLDLPPNVTSTIYPCDKVVLLSMKYTYRSVFMHHVLLAVNNGKDIQTILKKFTIKDAIWAIAKGWDAVTPSTLKNGWHKLWPSLMFADVSEENDFKGFQVSQKKAVVCKLMEYANSFVNPKAQEMVKNVGEDHLMEWLDVDKDSPTAHQMTDLEIVELGKDSENDEVRVQERVSLAKCIQMTTDVIEAFEQGEIFMDQEIMKEPVIKEKPKSMKQTTMEHWFKRGTLACKQSAACESGSVNEVDINVDIKEDDVDIKEEAIEDEETEESGECGEKRGLSNSCSSKTATDAKKQCPNVKEVRSEYEHDYETGDADWCDLNSARFYSDRLRVSPTVCKDEDQTDSQCSDNDDLNDCGDEYILQEDPPLSLDMMQNSKGATGNVTGPSLLNVHKARVSEVHANDGDEEEENYRNLKKMLCNADSSQGTSQQEDEEDPTSADSDKATSQVLARGKWKRGSRATVSLTRKQETSIAEWYQANDFLYDKKHRDYFNLLKKGKTMKNKATEVGLTVPQLETWLASMRTNYGRLASTKSGQPPVVDDMSNWDRWIYTSFGFLKKHFVRCPGQQSMRWPVVTVSKDTHQASTHGSDRITKDICTISSVSQPDSPSQVVLVARQPSPATSMLPDSSVQTSTTNKRNLIEEVVSHVTGNTQGSEAIEQKVSGFVQYIKGFMNEWNPATVNWFIVEVQDLVKRGIAREQQQLSTSTTV